jgi:hypothetical protein
MLMTDPNTLGMLVAGALSVGAEAGKAAIGEVVKDAPLRQTTCRPNRNVTYGGDEEMTWVDIPKSSKIEQ